MEFLKSAKVVSILTFTSRVFGLVRDIATTAVLATRQCDALFLAWTIPNLFRKLFGEGALSSAFIPAFVRVQGRGDHGRTRAFASSVITALFLVLVTLTALFFVLSFTLPEAWLRALFQEDAAKMDETMELMRILIAYMIASCIIAQFQGILNSMKEFTIPALAPILLNIIWIASVGAAVLFAGGDSGLRVYVIAWGILFAGAMQVVLFLPSLGKRGLIPYPRVDWKDPDFRKVMALTAPMVLALSANQLNILVDRLVVQGYVPGDGGVTHLYVGNRLMQFPLALIGIALMTAVFPLLARLSSEGDREGMKQNLADATRINLFLSIPALVGLVVLADPIVALFFERGNFTAANTHATCRALVGYTVGLPFLSSVLLLTRAFYAMGRWKAPLYTGAALVALNVVLDFVLVVPLAEAGVAYATSITCALQALILFFLLRRVVGHMGGRILVKGALCSGLLSLLLGGAVYGTLVWLDSLGVADGILWRAARVGLPIAAGLVVYFVPARILCPFEFRSLVEAFRSRGGKSGKNASNS
jgi:putative peptidoglycan lipid II flippase